MYNCVNYVTCVEANGRVLSCVLILFTGMVVLQHVLAMHAVLPVKQSLPAIVNVGLQLERCHWHTAV